MLFNLIFTMCISTCKETVEVRKFENAEACERFAAKSLVIAQADIVRAKQNNIKVKFECKAHYDGPQNF